MANEDNGFCSAFPELGFYTLPGHTQTPADMIDEVQLAEKMGMGSAWISERFDVKEASALAGAACAATQSLFIGTAATNINLRHPMVTASMATTLHRLSHQRFALGVSRGVGIRADLMGLKKVTNAQLIEFSELMRKLWLGEGVGHDGKLGQFPYLSMAKWLDDAIAMPFVGFGPKSIALAAQYYDGVILHTFMSDEAVAASVKIVRDSAEQAGRDPESVRVWTVLATACDPDEEDYLRKIVARMATYMQAQGYGELLAKVNDWDQAVIDAFRKDSVVASMLGGIDSVASLEQLQHIRGLIPEHWLPAAAGSPQQCAERFNDQFRAGADGVIIHASTPSEFTPIIETYKTVRDNEKFSQRSNQPFLPMMETSA